VYLSRGRAYQSYGDLEMAVVGWKRVLELNAKPNVRRKAEFYLAEPQAVVAT
jgi:hypothetical protein